MFLGFFVTRYHELAFFSRFCFLTVFSGGNCYLIHGIKVVSVLSITIPLAYMDVFFIFTALASVLVLVFREHTVAKIQ